MNRLTEALVHVCGFEAHQVGQLVDDELALGGAFVDALDAATLPVRPVDVVAQQREAEDVREFVLHQHTSTCPVHVHHLRHRAERYTLSMLSPLHATTTAEKHLLTEKGFKRINSKDADETVFPE